MGRNADKRKAKKGGTDAPSEESAPVAVSTTSQEGPAISRGPRSLAGDFEMPLDGDDGSISRALFKVTCLLAVRDGQGVPRENLARVASEVAGIVEADTVSILRLERGDDVLPARLALLGSHGLAPVDEGLVTFELGDGVAGQVALSGQAMSIEDAPRDPRFHRLYGQRTEIGSLLAVPLRYQKRVLGVVTASRREIKAFSLADQERLRGVCDSIAQDLEQTRLLFDAVTDPLTGLHSRLSLLVALPREVEIARRYRTDLSLLIFDADGLGAVNAKLGRPAGDRVLVEAARRLRASLRAADLPVRLGGDELAVLLPMTPANASRALAKRLSRALAQPVPGHDGEPPTWSVGVATLAVADEDALG
ncbi:MAG TPA: sensor domain-containing diguanylate cyclase, partial [Myxococcota bacterium]